MYIHNIKQTDYPNDVTILEVPCPQCGKTSVLKLSTKVWLKGLTAYKNGAKVQDAWPTIPPADRELFITGICERCWDDMFNYDR